MWRRKKRPEPWKGAAAGLIGGLVASWTMNQFQAGWSKAAEKLKNRENGQQQEEQQESQAESEGPLEKVAGAVSRTVLRQEIDSDQRKKYGMVVHYAFGAAMGGIYGGFSELMPRARAGFGALYGTTLFAGADELALPALKLSQPPTRYPLSTHAYAFASHCVYGVTTEAVRRVIRRIW